MQTPLPAPPSAVFDVAVALPDEIAIFFHQTNVSGPAAIRINRSLSAISHPHHKPHQSHKTERPDQQHPQTTRLNGDSVFRREFFHPILGIFQLRAVLERNSLMASIFFPSRSRLSTSSRNCKSSMIRPHAQDRNQL